MKFSVIFFLLMFFYSTAKSDELSSSIDKAHSWLKQQIVPNDIVTNPPKNKHHLILSYQTDKNDPHYQYIFSKSSLYDNALAVIVFSMLKDFSLAQKIIDAVKSSTLTDNKLWFTFNTHNYWPNQKDHDGAIIRNGASAWFGYAITYYLNSKAKVKKNYLQSDEGMSNKKFLKSIASSVAHFQIKQETDKRYGLITGGEGSYIIRKNSLTSKVEELFIPGPIEWCSMEHNIDTYFLLRDAGQILSEKLFSQAADLLKSSLLKISWNPNLSQFNRGQNAKDSDFMEALDTASWGAIFLSSVGESEKANLALEKTQKYLNTEKNHYGYKPYLNMLVYEDLSTNRLLFPHKPNLNWNDVDIAWFEGSFGVVLAQVKLGFKKQASLSLKKMINMQDKNGAFPYSTKKIQFQFTDSPSVASTAWFIIAALAINDKEIAQSFWRKDL